MSLGFVFQSFIKGAHELGSLRDEAVVNVHHAEELCRDLTVSGRGKFTMASTFNGRGMAPSLLTQCPRKSMVDSPNWHLARLMISPCWLSHSKRVLRWNMCAAFFRPNGMRKNSKSPNGVITAVLGTSSRWAGTW